MTDAVVHSPAIASALASHTISRLGLLGARLRQALRRAIVAHRTRRELYGLPDDVLRDIGLTRGDIPYVALNPSPAPPRADSRRATVPSPCAKCAVHGCSVRRLSTDDPSGRPGLALSQIGNPR
jgi:uncharacterized protein YjiS (DUF1127 family)